MAGESSKLPWNWQISSAFWGATKLPHTGPGPLTPNFQLALAWLNKWNFEIIKKQRALKFTSCHIVPVGNIYLKTSCIYFNGQAEYFGYDEMINLKCNIQQLTLAFCTSILSFIQQTLKITWTATWPLKESGKIKVSVLKNVN